MKSKLRSVNTRFWDDPFVEDLTPSEKLLFLYLLTNSLTNLLGIYEITIKRITFDTGLNKESVLKALESFERLGKVYFISGFIVLPNFLKNQNLNPNMIKNVISEFGDLPEWLKTKLLENSEETQLNGLETIRNALAMLRKDEGEDEEEIEEESEGEEEAEILKYYHSVCLELPKVQKLTPKRKASLKARIKEYGAEAINEVIENAAMSEFLNGKNDRNWKADFEWLMKPENFLKVFEGKYNSSGFISKKRSGQFKNPETI
jgi:hypothetical protein